MRTIVRILAVSQVATVAALAIGLRSGRFPLGVPGEWEWLRLPAGPAAIDVALAALAVLAYAGVAALGFRSLAARATPMREGLAVAGLLAASTAMLAVVPSGAPEGYGLAKWSLVLYAPSSTGYYTVAKREVRDAGRFLADYPDWIRRQDALHVGTHPPGLFLVEHALLAAFEARPDRARRVVDLLPATVVAGFRVINDNDRREVLLPPADQAALGLTGALTLLACAATVVPLYALARAYMPAPSAWAAATLWPLVPSAILFQPDADTAFPLLSASALALASYAGRPDAPKSRGLVIATAAGVLLAAGMAFTLAFLPVGLIAGIVLLTAPGVGHGRRLALVAATGAGFLAPTLAFWLATGADPFVIWWWNQRNHARFYQQSPRTYRAWVLANPIELAVALGIPPTLWAIAGLAWPRDVPRVAWATLAVLAFLTLGGRNLSEVARIWLPFFPPLLVAAGHGLSRLGAGPGTLAGVVLTLGAETLFLQATIQVVYPF
jgi:methylthioxylose transferase